MRFEVSSIISDFSFNKASSFSYSSFMPSYFVFASLRLFSAKALSDSAFDLASAKWSYSLVKLIISYFFRSSL